MSRRRDTFVLFRSRDLVCAILHVRVNVASESARKMCVRSIMMEWERGGKHTWQRGAIGRSAKRCDGLGIEGHNPLDRFETRTKVVYEHCRTFDERKHRVLPAQSFRCPPRRRPVELGRTPGCSRCPFAALAGCESIQTAQSVDDQL
jgi:hypothetical protein